MNKIFKKVTLYFVAIMAMMATSCSDDLAAVDPIAVDDLSGDRTITFTATVEAETRGYTAISLFDYYRIYAYNTVEGLFIDGAEMKFADNEWTIDATYEMPGSGTSYFFAVSDQDIANSGVTFVNAGADSYIDYTMPSNVEDQPILLMAKSEESDGSSFVINFAFKYILTPVALEASGDYYSIEEVTISNYYNSAKFSFKADDGGNLTTDNNITYPDSKDGSYTIAPDPGVTSGAITDATSGWLMMPPQSTEGFVLDITSYHYDDGVKDSDINGVREAIIEGDNIAQLEMGSSYTFKIGTNQIASDEPDEDYDETVGEAADDADFTNSDSANCYMLHPNSSLSQVFYIPVEERINTFWGNKGYENVSENCLTSTSKWTAEILWGDVASFDGLEVARAASDAFDGGSDIYSALKVTLPAGFNEGNVVVAVKNEEGTTLWSWHLWITSYNPDEAKGEALVTDECYPSLAVAGGYVERYCDDPDHTINMSPYVYFKLWSNAYEPYGDTSVHVMDRYIGAYSRSYSTAAGGVAASHQGKGALYYQFGRKDPFPGTAGKFYSGSDYDPGYWSASSAQTMSFAVNNPTRFVEYSGDWCSDYNESSNGKVFWKDPYYVASSAATSISGAFYPYDNVNGKSIFDPSPVGWRMPDWLTWTWFDAYNHTGYPLDTTGVFSTYGYLLLNTNSQVTYMGVGYRNGSNADLSGGKTTVWSWSNYPSYSMKYVSDDSSKYTSVDPFTTGTPTSYALPVRPVRESN